MSIDTLVTFSAGDGISAPDLNQNFEDLRVASNTNESNINTINSTMLKKDGTNVTNSLVDAFNRMPVVVLGTSGTLTLTDNADHFLAPTGNCTLTLPTISQGDLHSHTINVAVQGSNYSVTHGLSKHLLNDIAVDTTAPYNLLFMYNHSDNSWYYYLTQ